MRNPATYSKQFLPIFYDVIKVKKIIYDPFAGTGKIALIKEFGFTGKIYCNDLEPEYKLHDADLWFNEDAEFCNPGYIDAIVTSPTYGNRMADSHNAKDNSKRLTYTHCLGRKLTNGNTGCMQWGNLYRDKHKLCYEHFYTLLQIDGIMVINISDHIRKGEIVNVTDWHIECISNIGFGLIGHIKIPVKRLRFGANNKIRVDYESILIFKK